VWDANEVWMITAGGAIFAAFPQWYATLFSGFYLALVVILLALILRGVAFEFRSKDENPQWRTVWDWAIFFGSAIPALLWGVAFGNLVQGTPINASMHFTGNFFDLLSPYSLICGLAGFMVFLLHGAIFITLRTEGDVRERAEALSNRLWIPTVAAAALLAIANQQNRCQSGRDAGRVGGGDPGGGLLPPREAVRLGVRPDGADDLTGGRHLFLVPVSRRDGVQHE
jgi:cytochrome d ubiquinol oxidase subunit II